MQRLMALIAIWTAKFVFWLVHLSGKGKGSSLPGMIALKIFPGILNWFGGRLPGHVVMITGTNGKTTTSNMLTQVISSRGYSVLSNYEGANLITGVTSVFIRNANLWGHIYGEYIVLEVDEASFPRVSTMIAPDLVIVTNFFQDQLDRYGELETTARMVAGALSQLNKTTIVLNADDPLVVQLGWKSGLKTFYYGLEYSQDLPVAGAGVRDAKYCPLCQAPLNYSRYVYSQLGKFNCSACGFKRPAPDLYLYGVTQKDGLFDGMVAFQDQTYLLSVPAGGVYNLYNAIAALSGAVCLDIEPGPAARVLSQYIPPVGRMDRFEYEDKSILLNLVKNPTGFNQVLTTIISRDGVQDLLIAINDRAADGRDVSWLWDVDFEIMEGLQDKFCSFVCTGQRAEEAAVRLKYAGVPLAKIKVFKNIEQAVDHVLFGNGEAGSMLATYTALWLVESNLLKKAKRVKSHVENMPSVS